MVKYIFLLIPSLIFTISCTTIKSKSNFIPKQNTEFHKDNGIAYLGTIIHSPAIRKLIGSKEEKNEWFTEIEESNESVFDIAKKSFEYGNLNLEDNTENLSFNSNLADEFHYEMELYETQNNVESLPNFPKSLIENKIKPKQRYGIINIFSTSEVESQGPGIGFGRVTLSVHKTLLKMNFTSLLLDFETQQVVSYYNFTDEYYTSLDAFETIFESLLLAYNSSLYVRPKVLNDLKDYDKFVHVEMKDGQLYFCQVKYLGDFKMQLNVNNTTTVYRLDEFASIKKNNSDKKLIPSN